MNIKLIQKIPQKDGYYLMKFARFGGWHLVMLRTELSSRREILFDSCFSEHDSPQRQEYRIKSIFIEELPAGSWWSEEPIYCVE